MPSNRDPVIEAQAARALRPWILREADLLHLMSVRIGAAYTSVKDAAARLGIPVSLARAPVPAPTHRHVKRGTTYAELRRGRLQTDVPLDDMSELVAYEAADGQWWFRTPQEFDDPARFEKLPEAAQPNLATEPAQFPLRDGLYPKISGWDQSTYAGRVQLLAVAYECLLHEADRAALGQRPAAAAAEPSYQELVTTLELIRHATAPAPADGGHHENAHDLADQILQRVNANGAAAAGQGASA